MTRTGFLCTATLALAMVAVAACARPARDAEPATPAPAPAPNVVERLAAHGSYDTLTAAIQAAGMVELLDGPGTFTVFAPTDDAFAALPPGTVESLLQPARRDELVALLSHHVVVAELGSAQLAGKVQVIDTYYGDRIEIDGLDGRLAVDGVPIVDPDNLASNGLIHGIGGVLLP